MVVTEQQDSAQELWWQTGIIYQIYPRSFQDSNGDGVGDLRGIEQRLGYLADLGVSAIWISPIFPSPMRDFGYDISDYCDIEPIFGSLEQFDQLMESAHRYGLKILLDFVPGHTSDLHPWFAASRSSRDNPQRDWYIWRDPADDGGPPSNWISEFGGSAWTLDQTTGQYYLHIYLRQQPTLNWRNPEVQAEMLNVMRFWFDRGVDGFRIDAVENLVPDYLLRNNPPNPDWQTHMGPARSHLRAFTAHQPEVLTVARQMRQVADEYAERVLVGEAYGSIPEVMAYYGQNHDGFHLPFNFELITAAWDARKLAALVEAYEAALPPGAWPNWVLGNHDRPRIASRVGPEQARVAAMLLLTLRGTPTIYQGDELGMLNGVIPPEAVRDPWEINVPGQGLGRDPVRTPMLWDNSANAGFTTGQPWLPLSQAAPMSEQADDPKSMLSLYRRLIALRQSEPALCRGAYRTLQVDEGVFVYERSQLDQRDRRFAIALNLTADPQPLQLTGRVVLSTRPDRVVGESATDLLPNEGLILDELVT